MIFANTLFDLSGKAALVVGSSRGIGRATAHRLMQHGADVIISGRNAETCDQTTAELNAERGDGWGRAVAIPANILKEEDIDRLVDGTVEAFGKVDILVCSAAANLKVGSLFGNTDAVFRKTLELDFMSLHQLCTRVLPGMVERGFGRIIAITSMTGVLGSGNHHSYSVAKAAEMQYVRNLACEFGRHNITANAIAPGLTKTEGGSYLWGNPELLKLEMARNPAQRVGEPDEIAGAAVWLASNAAGYTNGQVISCDGGYSICFDVFS
jgi:NAD(P)-dependent dehydrogenase (short-subunit alcohol dehydrogenase family)